MNFFCFEMVRGNQSCRSGLWHPWPKAQNKFSFHGLESSIKSFSPSRIWSARSKISAVHLHWRSSMDPYLYVAFTVSCMCQSPLAGLPSSVCSRWDRWPRFLRKRKWNHQFAVGFKTQKWHRSACSVVISNWLYMYVWSWVGQIHCI